MSEKVRWHERVPGALWGAVVAVVLGFVVSLRSTTETFADGETTCTSVDYADLLFAVVGFACVVATVVSTLGRPAERRLGSSILVTLVVFLGGLSVYHGLTGLGRVGGPCA